MTGTANAGLLLGCMVAALLLCTCDGGPQARDEALSSESNQSAAQESTGDESRLIDNPNKQQRVVTD